MSRKVTSLDELGINPKSAGLYCICGYNVDAKEKSLFKVGFTESIGHRLSQYETAFASGVWIVSLNLNTNRRKLRSGSARATLQSQEKLLFELLNKLGAVQWRSTARIMNKPNIYGGLTEHFYTDVGTIHEAFRLLNLQVGGQLYNYELNKQVTDKYNREQKTKDIVFETKLVLGMNTGANLGLRRRQTI